MDAFVIASVGELNDNKNHKVIIEAISQLKEKEQIHYVIAGIGDNADKLRKLAQELNVNLHLMGYRKDIPQIYKSADLCAFPSIREGLGMAAIEGMNCELPLLVARNRGTVEFLQKGTMVCRYFDVNAFATGIEKLYYNRVLCIEMGEANRVVSEKFGVCIVNRRMKEIYEQSIVE